MFSLSSENILNGSSYVPYPPAVHKWIQRGVNENSSRNMVISNLHRSCVSNKCVDKNGHKEWNIDN